METAVDSGDGAMTAHAPPPKGDKNAVAHTIAAFGYSMAGAAFLMEQRAARLQVVMGAVTVVLFALTGVSVLHWAIMGALFAVGLGVEALNTAIELVVDRTSPEISDYAKHAKDLGSFAVFCALTVFCGHALWALLAA
ncbi:MAG: diacylglycerol kinase [Jannaschia sp.]